MKTFLFLVLTILTLAGCNSNTPPVGNEVSSLSESASGTKNDITGQKILKEATLSLKVNKIDAAVKQVRKELPKYKAQIDEDNRVVYRTMITNTMTIRVPSENFENLMQSLLSISQIKEVTNKSVNTLNIADSYIDIDARLKVKKETEQKYMQLLKQAKNLQETMAIEKQLTETRDEIDALEGQLKNVHKQVTYSTIQLTLNEEVQFSSRFFVDFMNGIRGGWQVFLYLLTLFAYLWVIALAVIVTIVGYRKLRKKK
ncbi:MAG: DUF4349 domain-containing protein [Bacteroidota bacterium]|nr:DUF4349 domain-containing protein [Bacteroidota bacterium]MDP4204715.1 DUF4349 domain-containing protein [Bacteroidota bacterium]